MSELSWPIENALWGAAPEVSREFIGTQIQTATVRWLSRAAYDVFGRRQADVPVWSELEEAAVQDIHHRFGLALANSHAKAWTDVSESAQFLRAELLEFYRRVTPQYPESIHPAVAEADIAKRLVTGVLFDMFPGYVLETPAIHKTLGLSLIPQALIREKQILFQNALRTTLGLPISQYTDRTVGNHFQADEVVRYWAHHLHVNNFALVHAVASPPNTYHIDEYVIPNIYKGMGQYHAEAARVFGYFPPRISTARDVLRQAGAEAMAVFMRHGLTGSVMHPFDYQSRQSWISQAQLERESFRVARLPDEARLAYPETQFDGYRNEVWQALEQSARISAHALIFDQIIHTPLPGNPDSR